MQLVYQNCFVSVGLTESGANGKIMIIVNVAPCSLEAFSCTNQSTSVQRFLSCEDYLALEFTEKPEESGRD